MTSTFTQEYPDEFDQDKEDWDLLTTLAAWQIEKEDKPMLELIYKRMLGEASNWFRDGKEVRYPTARNATLRIARAIKDSDAFWKNNRAHARPNYSGLAAELDLFLAALVENTPNIKQRFVAAALVRDQDAPVERIHVFYPYGVDEVAAVHAAARRVLEALAEF